ncbi:MBOAT family O-acyltransferase [Paenibacillus timonensis]|uniref:MBOAT family O-acyltransferase n=1 Tax=Paenibacillus timonensis TaxID=225915 RepID=UPI003F9E2BBB
MVFSSLMFLFQFLPITLLVYYLSPPKLRNAVLLAASLVFYAWGEPLYVFIMMFSTLVNYAGGLMIEKYRERRGIAQGVLLVSLIVNLGLLFFFKYAEFVLDNLNGLLHLQLQIAELPLPLGISFYTFQTLSYVIDVYRHKVTAQRNLISFGAYVAMFPQLVAGPIVKYGDIARQLVVRHMTLDRFGRGAELFIRGLAKKALLANQIGLLWTNVKATPPGELSVLSAWLGILAFTFQIYFDFSGYSDMARGLGKMFGFEFAKNFNYPYVSRSVTEFWRRWHISLGSWFREYVYIPLGGNRKGLLMQLRNVLIVWFLTGLWHGASWNFIVWGLYFGFLVTVEKLFWLKGLRRLPRFVAHGYTLTAVIVGWVFFEYDKLETAGQFLGTLFGYESYGIVNQQALYDITTYAGWLVLLAVCATPLPRRLLLRVRKRRTIAGSALTIGVYLLLLLLSTANLVHQTYNPFLYFRF